MNIVAAGVHHAGNRGGVGQLGLLDDGQCVDIGAQSRGDAKKPSREERKRSAVKAAARARYADSRPVKRGKGSAKKEKQ